jgi:DNA-binding GntR family transcriptional regulator
LIELSGNRRLLETYDQLNAHLQIARIHQSTDDWPQRKEQERGEHEEIYEALKARDPRRLSAALARHIERAKQALIADLETLPS